MSGITASPLETEPWPTIDTYLLTALWTVGVMVLAMFATLSFCIARSLFAFHEKLIGIQCILELITKLPVERYTLQPDLVSKIRHDYWEVGPLTCDFLRQDVFQQHKKSAVDDSPQKRSFGKSKSDIQPKLQKITGFKNVLIDNKAALKNVKASTDAVNAKVPCNSVTKINKSQPQKGPKL
uniref:Uncharacterized protein n=1 Tax=Romanomermis culicivorax TaxID=13658 RepID=A0A915I1Y3_ROMCU